MKSFNLIKNIGRNLTIIPDEHNSLTSYHEYFCIHDDIFDRNQSTRQANNTSLNIASNEPNKDDSQCGSIDIFDYNICKKNKLFINNVPRHTIQIKGRKFQ